MLLSVNRARRPWLGARGIAAPNFTHTAAAYRLAQRSVRCIWGIAGGKQVVRNGADVPTCTSFRRLRSAPPMLAGGRAFQRARADALQHSCQHPLAAEQCDKAATIARALPPTTAERGDKQSFEFHCDAELFAQIALTPGCARLVKE